MAIRITGMYSGLDTESIINELASAQSMKVNSLKKKQIKLSWKQDAWKALNTKIYSFYTNVVDNMRFQASFLKKATKVSNSNAVSVVTSNNAPNSVQRMKISQLAKEAYLTSGKLQTKDGKNVTESTKLSELGFTGTGGSFDIKVGNKTTKIDITGDTTISDVVKKLESAGVNASFDTKNQRFYISSKYSGKNADFSITGNDADGLAAMKALGLMTKLEVPATGETGSSAYEEYKAWQAYLDKANGGYTSEFIKAINAGAKALAASKKAENDNIVKMNAENADKLVTAAKEMADAGYSLDEKTADALYKEIYGEQDTEADGKPKVDGDGNPVWKSKGLTQQIEDKQKAIADAKAAGTDTTTLESDLADLQARMNKAKGQYSYQKYIEDGRQAIKDNADRFNANAKYYQTDEVADYNGGVTSASGKGAELDEDGNAIATGVAELGTDNEVVIKDAGGTVIGKVDKDTDGKFIIKDSAGQKVTNIAGAEAVDEIAKYYMSKVEMADDILANLGTTTDTTTNYATKIDGQDAVISLNGVEYTNNTNTFEVNGLTITAQLESDEEITLTTTEDTDGIFDMIKNFFTEYNKLINEMDKLYNADANKGYDPLLSEEKSAMSDSEIEEWENKVKESLLRRDSTLDTVSSAMKTIMLAGVEVNGKKMYLSDFGINTLGYFNAADNEKSAYHIDGDPDDPSTKTNDETLKNMIATDPDTVMKFFTGLSNTLHDKLNELMASSTSSSAFTVYNDKDMKEEYDDYNEKISKQETKVNNLIDKWYQKFSAMETALAKLESKSNAVASMLGG